tara:strand:- start:421 stop:792 length:372 start_codon:yes stop_codon:yes gene_type:complete
MADNLRDFYSRDTEAPKYQDTRLEVDEALDDLIIKIENTLFTRRTSVLGAPDFGCNLDDMIFSLTSNEDTIRNVCGQQVVEYCLTGQDGFVVDVQVKFFQTPERSGCFIDIFVNDQRVVGVLY